MATITEADAQAWLERQADHFMESGEFTSDVLSGITRFGIRVPLSTDGLRAAAMYGYVDLMPVEFHATWAGMELTTARDRATRKGNFAH